MLSITDSRAACGVGVSMEAAGGSCRSFSPVHALLILLRACLVPVLCFSLLVVSHGPTAQAATWPLSTSRHFASLGFHESYNVAGSSYVHSGVDMSASSGASISAPAEGTVSFVGSVPSGDSAVGEKGTGETMLAVSIKIADGYTVTLMPFSSTDVTRGASVREGDSLGTLAAGGDRSSKATHLHMGLKKNGTYYDPLSLFGQVVEAEPPAASGVVTAAQTENAMPEPAVQPRIDSQMSQAPSKVESVTVGEQAQPEWQPGSIESSGVAGLSAQADAPSPFEAIGAALTGFGAGLFYQGSELAAGLSALITAAGAAGVIGAAAVFSVLVFAGMRLIVHVRKKRLLRLTKGEEALRKKFSLVNDLGRW